MSASEAQAGGWSSNISGSLDDEWTLTTLCPSGYHIPTKDEWANMHLIGGWGQNGTQIRSDLKLPFAGARSNHNATSAGQDTFAIYWSSSAAPVTASYAYNWSFSPDIIGPSSYTFRATGYSFRCFKD